MRDNNHEDINIIYAKAVELHQQGQHDEAIRLYSEIARLVPDVPEVHYNLGLALFETEQFGAATDAYARAAELRPDDEDIFYNLGLAYKKDNNFVEAEKAYLEALALAPSDTDIVYNLGCCYRDAGEVDHARQVFDRLVRKEPNHLPAMNNLAYLHHLAGEHEPARKVYERILQLDPGHASARYMQSILKGVKVDVPPQEYIRSLFDQYSDTFEENLLEDLEYNLYLDLRAKFDSVANKKRIYQHCLDLGSGTGLSGEAFRTACHFLSGVDLSPKMIEQAEAKEIYDILHNEEIVTFLRKASHDFDLFIAADVLIYRGELPPLFEAAAGRSSEDALFCLSIEKTDKEDWVVQPNGRYAHHPEYIRQSAGENGWKVELAADTKTRREKDSWVQGMIFILRRHG